MNDVKYFVALIMIFAAFPAFAENDGAVRVGVHAVPGTSIDIAPDSVDRDELAPAVRDELDAGTAHDAQQDAHIQDHAETLALHSTQLAEAASAIGSLETVTASQGLALAAHDALLSDHARQIGEHSQGLAIAMAMPDAWLADGKRFGIFGAVGGFEGETAIGLAMIARVGDGATVNAKFGADTGFEVTGWQIGAGFQF